MGKYKTKAIQVDLGIIRHNQPYSGIIRAYSEPCVTLAYLELWYIQNPGIFRTRNICRNLVYLDSRYFQNADIFKTQGISYSEPSQTSRMKSFARIVNGYNYFHKL